MLDATLLSNFQRQFDDLISVVDESNNRVISDPGDKLFKDYLNVFTKSYVVVACSILEAFIQDLAFAYVDEIDSKLQLSNIPRNLVVFSVQRDAKNPDFRFEPFSTGISKTVISDLVSGNFYKTINVFRKIGIQLENINEFINFKDFISSTVEKRNNIVHHNHDASDISLADVINILEKFKEYIEIMYNIVICDQHIRTNSLEA